MTTQIADLDSERSVLGACLQDPGALWDVIDILVAEDFHTQAHQDIYAAMVSLAETNRSADLVVVTNTLREDGNLERIGGASYLSSLDDSCPDVANARYYAEIVQSNALRRRLNAAGRRLVNETERAGRRAADILDGLQAELLILAGRSTTSRPQRLGEIAQEVAREVAEIRAGNLDGHGLRTGIDVLDAKLGGLRPKKLYILAARPSVGKSALAGQISTNIAGTNLREGTPVAFFSLEMSREEVIHRVLAAECEINLAAFTVGTYTERDEQQIRAAAARLRDAPLWVDEKPAQTATEIRAKARRIQAEHGLGLVVVDYLGLMSCSLPGRSREQEVATISASLKTMAKELAVPVLALSQFSRAAETGGGSPKLWHLRDSGALEQDADVCMILHRPRDGEPLIELNVAKNRQGPVGMVRLRFQAEYTRFEEDWRVVS